MNAFCVCACAWIMKEAMRTVSDQHLWWPQLLFQIQSMQPNPPLSQCGLQKDHRSQTCSWGQRVTGEAQRALGVKLDWSGVKERAVLRERCRPEHTNGHSAGVHKQWLIGVCVSLQFVKAAEESFWSRMWVWGVYVIFRRGEQEREQVERDL